MIQGLWPKHLQGPKKVREDLLLVFFFTNFIEMSAWSELNI